MKRSKKGDESKRMSEKQRKGKETKDIHVREWERELEEKKKREREILLTLYHNYK